MKRWKKGDRVAVKPYGRAYDGSRRQWIDGLPERCLGTIEAVDEHYADVVLDCERNPLVTFSTNVLQRPEAYEA